MIPWILHADSLRRIPPEWHALQTRAWSTVSAHYRPLQLCWSCRWRSIAVCPVQDKTFRNILFHYWQHSPARRTQYYPREPTTDCSPDHYTDDRPQQKKATIDADVIWAAVDNQVLYWWSFQCSILKLRQCAVIPSVICVLSRYGTIGKVFPRNQCAVYVSHNIPSDTSRSWVTTSSYNFISVKMY